MNLVCVASHRNIHRGQDLCFRRVLLLHFFQGLLSMSYNSNHQGYKLVCPKLVPVSNLVLNCPEYN